MEFPDLGKNCALESCKQLDFLPLKCDACQKIFCKDHIKYTDHHCEHAYKKDVQVPICPLCNQPVPVPRGEQPDIKVGEHIDRDCQEVKKRKAYANKCTLKGCKQKELIPVRCESCRQNFCLKHRHEQDHSCTAVVRGGAENQKTSAAALRARDAAIARSKQAAPSKPNIRPQQTALSSMGRDLDRARRERQNQPGASKQSPQRSALSEDEALAMAIQASLRETSTSRTNTSSSPTLTPQENDDLLLAQALAQSEKDEAERQRRAKQGKSSDCSVS